MSYSLQTDVDYVERDAEPITVILYCRVVVRQLSTVSPNKLALRAARPSPSWDTSRFSSTHSSSFLTDLSLRRLADIQWPTSVTLHASRTAAAALAIQRSVTTRPTHHIPALAAVSYTEKQIRYCV